MASTKQSTASTHWRVTLFSRDRNAAMPQSPAFDDAFFGSRQFGEAELTGHSVARDSAGNPVLVVSAKGVAPRDAEQAVRAFATGLQDAGHTPGLRVGQVFPAGTGVSGTSRREGALARVADMVRSGFARK